MNPATGSRWLQTSLQSAEPGSTLFAASSHLKRLVELIEDGQGRLSVVLAGPPKLCNDLRRPTLEEIDDHTDLFSLDGITGSQCGYIGWLLQTCPFDRVQTAEDILTEEAIDLLANRLRTPLQIQQHFTLALEAGDR